jgi:hypothetical protein
MRISSVRKAGRLSDFPEPGKSRAAEGSGADGLLCHLGDGHMDLKRIPYPMPLVPDIRAKLETVLARGVLG